MTRNGEVNSEALPQLQLSRQTKDSALASAPAPGPAAMINRNTFPSLILLHFLSRWAIKCEQITPGHSYATSQFS